MKKQSKESSERVEVLMRILVTVVTGIILGVWRYLIIILVVVNWIQTLVTGRRMKELAEMSEIWNTQVYIYLKYLTMVSNNRPFPFERLGKNLSGFK